MSQIAATFGKAVICGNLPRYFAKRYLVYISKKIYTRQQYTKRKDAEKMDE
jgi:hypothetical protein